MLSTLLKLVLALALVGLAVRIFRKGRGADGSRVQDPAPRPSALKRLHEMRREIAWGAALVACSATAIALSTGPNVNAWVALGVLTAVLIVSITVALT